MSFRSFVATPSAIALFASLNLAAGCGGATPAPTQGTTMTPPSGAPEAAAEPAAPASAADQIAMGADLYKRKCSDCHGKQGEGDGKIPAIVGKAALPVDPPAGSSRKTQLKTAADLIAFVRETMPPNKPKSLSEADATAVVAFALHANGVTVDTPLDAAGAKTMAIHP